MSEELKACPFCGGRAEIRDHRYQGTGASGMETPNPYGACAKGCVSMKPVPCDDSPYGRKIRATTYKKARAIAVANWNTRTPAPSDAARRLTRWVCACGETHASITERCKCGWSLTNAPTPPPMETSAVEELLREAVEHMESMLRCSSNCGDPDAECPMQDAHKDSDMAGIVRRSKAALTRLRATTTGTKENESQ